MENRADVLGGDDMSHDTLRGGLGAQGDFSTSLVMTVAGRN